MVTDQYDLMIYDEDFTVEVPEYDEDYEAEMANNNYEGDVFESGS